MTYPYSYGWLVVQVLIALGSAAIGLVVWMMSRPYYKGGKARGVFHYRALVSRTRALGHWLNPFKWTRTITNLEGEPVMFIKTLWKGCGRHIDLHKFIKADKPYCFHTHPAFAYRFCLAGGYREEVYDFSGEFVLVSHSQLILPGHFSLVEPEHCHRIDELVNGKASWSLWFRGPVIAKIILVGDGWPPEKRGLHRASGDNDELGKDLA
jgi:hypothetical protein